MATNTKSTEILTPEQKEAAQKKQAELAKRHAELRTRMSQSKLSITPPAGFTPYWARKDDTAELARLDYLGFRVVKETPGQPDRYKAQGRRADGTYVMGDVILMEIQTEDYQFYLRENSERSSMMSQAAKQKFEEDAEKLGAPTFKLDRKA